MVAMQHKSKADVTDLPLIVNRSSWKEKLDHWIGRQKSARAVRQHANHFAPTLLLIVPITNPKDIIAGESFDDERGEGGDELRLRGRSSRGQKTMTSDEPTKSVRPELSSRGDHLARRRLWTSDSDWANLHISLKRKLKRFVSPCSLARRNR
jgi:hypothetical protein